VVGISERRTTLARAFLRCVPDQGVAGFCDDGVVEIDRFLELWMHEPPWGK
jgi:hypothetical protein